MRMIVVLEGGKKKRKRKKRRNLANKIDFPVVSRVKESKWKLVVLRLSNCTGKVNTYR